MDQTKNNKQNFCVCLFNGIRLNERWLDFVCVDHKIKISFDEFLR